jgi:hypothetical protein
MMFQLHEYLTGLIFTQQILHLGLLLRLLDSNNLAIRLLELRSLLFGVVVIEVQFSASFDVGCREEGNPEDRVAKKILRAAIRILLVGVVNESQLVAHVCCINFLLCTSCKELVPNDPRVNTY